MRLTIAIIMLSGAALAGDLGTGANQAYPGAAGVVVSNLAYTASTNAEAARVLGAAALPKTFTNAPAVTTLKITGGSPAVGDVFIITNANGSGTLNRFMETTRTISLTGTATEVNALIAAAGRYVPAGQTLTFQFTDGIHTLDAALNFRGFFGGGTVKITSSGTTTSAHTNQPATLNFTGSAVSGLQIWQNTCLMDMTNLRIGINGAAGYIAVYMRYNQMIRVAYNSIYSKGGSSSYGILVNDHSTAYTLANSIVGQAYGIFSGFASTTAARADTGSSNTKGYTATGGALFKYDTTSVGPTNTTGGGLFVANGTDIGLLK